MYECFALKVKPDGTGENDFFQVFSFSDEIFHGVFVGYFHDILLNDGTFIQIGGHIMAGGTDDFHSPLMRPVIGLGTCEGRQEGVVNVDDLVWKSRDKFITEDLHVPGQNDKIYFQMSEQRHLGFFYFCLIGFSDIKAKKRNVKTPGYWLMYLVVGNNGRNFYLPLSGSMPG